MNDFGWGVVLGIVTSIIALILFSAIRFSQENNGFKDRMTISYLCTDKEYERKLINDLVVGSGITTNFINKEVSMDKWSVRYKLTNPNK